MPYAALIGIGAGGRSGVLRDLYFSGNTSSFLFDVRTGYDLLIDGVVSEGDHARLLQLISQEIQGAGDISGVENFTMQNVTMESMFSTALDAQAYGSGAGQAAGTTGGRAVIIVTNFNGDAGWNGRLTNIKLKNITVRPQFQVCLVLIEDTVTAGRTELAFEDLTLNDELATGATGIPLCVADSAGGANYGPGGDLGLWTHRYMPRWTNVNERTIKWPDQPYQQIAIATAKHKTCANGAVGEVDEVPGGTIVLVSDDDNGTACLHAGGGGADGVLTGGGTTKRYCSCGTNGTWTAVGS